MKKALKPNRVIRRERELRGWSQGRLAQELDTTIEVVSNWERGAKTPSKHYQEAMCKLFNKTAEELGFIEREEEKRDPPTASANPPPSTENNPALSIEMIFWLITTYPAQFQALIQQLQSEPQKCDPQAIVEASSYLVDPCIQKEVSSPFPPVNIEDIMKINQHSEGEPVNTKSEGEDMDKGRRHVAISLVGAPLWVYGMGLQELNADIQQVLRQPSLGPGDKELTYLEQKIRDYWLDRSNASVAPADLMSHAVAYVQEVKDLLNRSLLPSIRMRLCACLSQGMLLIGANCHDAGQFQVARVCFQTALEAAYEANSNILQAQAWGWDSFSWLRSNAKDRYKHALDGQLKASHFASLESDLAVQCAMQADLAEVYAHLGQKDLCLEALKQASRLGGYGHGDWYHLHQFDDPSLNGYRGLCLQLLYRQEDSRTHPLLEEARQAIAERLSQPNLAPLQRAFSVSNMAQIYARKGEVEFACDYAKQIIGIAGTSAPLRQRLWTVCTLLEPYVDVAAVNELNREIRTLLLAG